jgi:hypothetical protein
MIRPMTSDVSALSGIVANGHQAIHFVSSAPSKIPYGGFSPVRLQTSPPEVTFRSLPAPRYRPLPPASVVHPRLCSVAWACAPSERAERCFRPARPVALGSASGYAVRRPHRLLRPHPSFCVAPPVLYVIAVGPSATQKVPTFICQSLMTCRRPYSEGSRNRARIQTPGLAFTQLEEARQPYNPHTRLRVVDFTKLQRSLNAAARHLAGPALDGAFTTELADATSLRRRSVITTGTFVSFLTGLSPAALTALWAALQPNPTKVE